MKEYISILNSVKLFKNIKENDIIPMLSCLGTKINDYKKGQFIFSVGDKVDHIGILLKGNVHVIKENFEGERTIIAALTTGDYFAEALCCAGIKESPVSVEVISDTKIILLPFNRILNTCSSSCLFHTKLIENMLYVIAQKNILMQNRMDILSQRTLRLKVLNYLQSLAAKQGQNIVIPFNREEFANFLCVDRSALSHELSRMQNDGLIKFHKNHFILL